ncbi:MAG: ATP-dependent DNA helicase RecG [Verrucomicrobia bacterium]|nr:ATP-dependent DNA helicase RecG [Verrucomicrobiota bacterium]
MDQAKDALETPISEIDWIPSAMVRPLHRLGVVTWSDLLKHYPRRHEDRSEFSRFPTSSSDKAVCVRGMVQKVTSRYFSGRNIVEATLDEGQGGALSGRLICRWFNQHYVRRMLAAGQTLVVYGRPKEQRRRIYLDHPDFEIIEEEEENLIHMNRITPVYPLTDGLRQRPLRTLMFLAVQRLNEIEDRQVLPGYMISFRDSIEQLHFPESWASLQKARRTLALVELVEIQVVVENRRRKNNDRPGHTHASSGKRAEKFLKGLPFQPTEGQRRTIEEIRADLAASRPMARLLHGDVGAGKTLVATAAMLEATEAGFQTALMAPTQVLAEQHYRTLVSWLKPMNIRIALRTGIRKEESFLPLQGEPEIVVGTHALLYETDPLPRLGLVVIDEQHKFGVLQRAQLLQRDPVPDLLVMTATPIPRTLAMTLYGDLEVSTLAEKPGNRKGIITGVRSSNKLPEAAEFLRDRLKAMRQAYIIYPVIEESDSLSVKAATTEFKRWETLLKPFSCGLLHGRLDGEERERVMERFRRGEIQVLIATTVIEVGVDVPNATVMLIENAERFGLAQLHQLRGRIGRGNHQSYCILMTDTKDPLALAKLSILEKTNDGFEIAEADLRFRGPGDLLGTAQSGLPPLRLADLLEDADLLDEARGVARNILDRDPKLQLPANQAFLSIVMESSKGWATLGN